MLNNASIKAARPGARPYKMGDGGGLYLLVAPTGRKTWRMKYRVAGREKLLTFGSYPDVDLHAARERREDARALMNRGIDPSSDEARATVASRSAQAADETFEAVARRWMADQRQRWTDTHAADVMASLVRDVFPAIGGEPVAAIDAPTVLRVLRQIEERGRVETARRVRQRMSAVFTRAMAEGLCTGDPAAIVNKAMAPAAPTRRQPALLALPELRALLAAVDALDAAPGIKLASRFLALTAVRLAAVRGACWGEIEDLDGAAPLWRVPGARMKMAKAKKAGRDAAHLVPLSPQAVDVLRQARSERAGGGEAGDALFPDLLFHGRAHGRPIGETAIGDLYARAGYGGRHVPHGWRASFSTILNEHRPADRALIDQALAHAAKDKVEAAYNRSAQLDRRRDLFVAWGQMLTGQDPPQWTDQPDA